MAPDTHQIHDNNPGFGPGGRLWTVPAPSSAVEVNFDIGMARYHMTNVVMEDYGTLANALFGGGGPGLPGPSVPSMVSWDLRLDRPSSSTDVRDATVGFTGTYKATDAHLDWSMEADGFSFRSNSQGQTVLTAFIGRERNGVFFS